MLMLEYSHMIKNNSAQHLRSSLRKITSTHYLLVIALAIQIIVYDAGRLITPTTVLQRWTALALLTSVITFVWYVSRNQATKLDVLKRLTATLVLADIAYASFSVYAQRGMASRAVILYLVPIITAAIIGRKSAIFGAAALSVSAYVTTAVAYFVLNFNEGYKIELYGEVGFYAVLFVILSSMIWTVCKKA